MIQDRVIGDTKTRMQNNFDSRLLAYGDDASLLNVIAPARSPQKCERYTLPELRLSHMEDLDCRQVIISETSTIGDVTRRIRTLIARKRALREEYAADVQGEWKKLLAANPKKVVWYKKTSTMAFRKAKWKKIPTGRSRVIRVRVYLKPRPTWVKIVVPVDWRNPSRGTKIERHLVPDYRPHVWREKIVPIYLKQMLRPAGLRRVTVRVKQTKQTYDWDKIRPTYVVYKIDRRVKLDAALDQVQDELNVLYRRLKQLIQQPHRLVAYSDSGWIPPSWKEYYYLFHRKRGDYEPVYAEAYQPHFGLFVERPGANWGQDTNTPFSCAVTGAFGLDTKFMWSAWDANDILASMRQRERGDFKWPSTHLLPFEAKDMLHPRTVVGRMRLLDGSTDQVDNQMEALAASTVRSLRNRSDYVFNLPRSIGELKDSKETFKQCSDFMRWIARGTRTRNVLPEAARITGSDILRRSGSASLALVGAFLAWKFAIQPTIQDCLTFRSHTAEWLMATRRHLIETIRTLENLSSNILHIRAKFRGDDAVRQRSLVNIAADVGMLDDVIVEMTQSTVLSSPLMLASSLYRGSLDELRGMNRYEVTPINWVPYSGCFPMQYSGGGYVHTGNCDLIKGPLFSVHIPEGAVTASCQFLKRKWVGSSALCSTGFDNRFQHEVGIESTTALKSFYEKEDWPKAEVTGFLKNHVEGVAFARYAFSNVLEFLEMDEQSRGLKSLYSLITKLQDWDKIFDREFYSVSKVGSYVKRAGSKLAEIEASWDGLYVTWQLTPLSFIYDWFTTSESIVTILNNFVTDYFVPAPPAMEGVWVTKRCELLAGRPGLTIETSKMQHYVSEWWTGCVGVKTYAPARQGGQLLSDRRHHMASPKVVISSMQLVYKPDREVSLARSGLYVAKRGEFISGGWETFLPQIQVKLNTNKVGTLLGILAGFIRPRR